MTRSSRLLSLVVLLALLAAVPCVRCLVTQAAGAEDDRRVLLLRTGRVLEGRVQKIATGWLVSQPNGHVVIPLDQVQFEADSLEDVYRSLRLEVREPTPGTHLKLADWCLSYKLYPEAVHELRDALSLDPSNETARVMLHRVEQDIRRQTQPADDAAPEPVSSVGVLRIGTRPSGDDVPDARSLAGLSRETADDFVSRIQPLLANKCGNARCHGTAATNDFRLEHVPRGSGSFRLRVERNLAAALKFVDPDMPIGSRLLMPINRSHSGRPVFSGHSGAEQAEILREWVLTAAAELHQSGRSRVRSIVAEGDPQLVSPGRDSALPSGSEAPAAELPPGGEPAGRVMPRGSNAATATSIDVETTGDRRLTRFQQLLIEVDEATGELDVFDPGEFNRRFATAPPQ